MLKGIHEALQDASILNAAFYSRLPDFLDPLWPFPV